MASADDLADRPAAAVRGSHRPDERSIVIENSRAPSDEPATALATDRPEEELQPIADSAEYGVQPELAEGVAGRPTPTLADAPAHNDSPATDETHEDFSADATASDGRPSPDGEDFVLAEDSAEEAVFQAASFNGIVPGESTRADLLKAWGEPLEQTTAGKTLSFDIDGFQAVAVSLLQDRVTAIRVELNRPASAEELAQKLRLSEYRPAYVKDDDGNVVSTIYPERGVTLGHAPDLGARGAPSGATQRSAAGVAAVYELVMRPIEATAFLRRAEATPRVEYAHRIADLEAAVDLDPNDVRANCQLAEAKLAVGEPLAAESIAPSRFAKSSTEPRRRRSTAPTPCKPWPSWLPVAPRPNGRWRFRCTPRPSN
ncbi:MAG: hypothetical protein DCC67_08510 [Planctomycetota bacterium]|nr:MAG: hypothetical protein DCC67_08510 [Planctomycetota bacterium]